MTVQRILVFILDFLDADPGWNTVSIALDGVVDQNQSQDGQFIDWMGGWTW